MRVKLYYLSLIRRQLFCVALEGLVSLMKVEMKTIESQEQAYFQCHEYSMCSADYSHDYRALLNSFLRVFDLENAALG